MNSPQIIRILARLFGEFLRETAVLIAVFVPLETIVQDKSLTVRLTTGILAAVIVLFVLGVALEVMSRWKA